MTNEDIVRIAREAGIWWADSVEMENIARIYLAAGAAAEREECDQLLEHIRGWVEAYPLSIFPEPDFGKAHKVLTENGMTLDAISASIMRHVITQVKEMVDAAIRARGQQ